LFVLNAVILAINLYNLYDSSMLDWSASFGTGGTFVGALWIWLCIWDVRSDLKLDKLYLLELKKSRDIANIKGVLAQYENAIQSYKETAEKVELAKK